MSYKVLARKWRPQKFKLLLGQTAVIQALQTSLQQNRLHHAYLFTGTRGVGKTTIARIFAKALNCETGINPEPCNKCPNCLAINDGTYLDLLEVDAASKTGVDDTRELLDSVQYLPSIGQYKVYLMDEVHMFSKSSFNALLKTLEEPPKHVIFLLATTDPKKLPPTVLSRCLQFNLSRISVSEISQYFAKLLAVETIEFEPSAIELLAVAADGSVRDGLSLLDQAIAFGGGAITQNSVQIMLGTVEEQHIVEILNHLANNDIDAVLQATQSLSQHVADFAQVLDALAHYLHRIAISQLTNNNELADLAAKFNPETIQLMYQIAIKSKTDLPLAPTMQIGLEMSLMRMAAFMPTTKKKPLN